MKKVTVTITACDRLDLLDRTLRSFVQFNTYPIEKFLIRDDSGLEDVYYKTIVLLSDLHLSFKMLERGQVGQPASIDLLLDEVETDYVFHLEDDWEFYRPHFIEDCFAVMNEKTAQVWVRSRDDGLAVIFGEEKERGGVKFSVVKNHNFSFNPHLRRMSDLRVTGKNETILSEWVRENGKETLWLADGYCKHIGWEKTTNRAGTPYQKGVIKA
jgi:hypothetical protein